MTCFSLSLTLAAGGGDPLVLRTIVAAIAGGVFLVVLARRLSVPAIVLLLLGGVLLGPQIAGDAALLQPRALGAGLEVIVSLSVGLILFEGGLTLEPAGYAQAPATIRRLLTMGVAVTWIGTSLALHFLAGIEWGIAITTASLVIVTGPTVVVPLLRRLQVGQRLASVLRWEAVLIDPIGVLIAILCFEWLIEDDAERALISLGLRIAVGALVGALCGAGIHTALKRRWIPGELLNVSVLAGAVLAFGAAEGLSPGAGLLSVTVAGFLLGIGGSAPLEEVREFKEQLTSLLIGVVFLLLAARLDLAQLKAFGWAGFAAVAAVIFVVRPLGILICTQGQGFNWREQTLLAWIAPRGVVAASMASLVGLHLEALGSPETARFVETFTWSVIVATIALQGLSARAVAKALGLREPQPEGWAIVGAHALGRALALRLREVPGVAAPVLIDTNPAAVAEARAEGLIALQEDARDPELAQHPALSGVGRLLALTGNEDLNARICASWERHLPLAEPLAPRLFRWATPRSRDAGPGEPLACGGLDPLHLAAEIEAGADLIQSADLHILSPLLQLPSGEWLGLRLTTSSILGAALRPEQVLVGSGDEPTRIRSALAAVARADAAFDPDLAWAQLEAQGVLSTSLAPGMELAHLRWEGDSPALVVVQAGEGLLLFLLVSPRAQPSLHLRALAELARALSCETTRAGLSASPDPSALYAALMRAFESNAARESAEGAAASA